MDDAIEPYQAEYASFQAAANGAKRIARLTGDVFSVCRNGLAWKIERHTRLVDKRYPEQFTSEYDFNSMDDLDDRTATYGLSPPDWASGQYNEMQYSSDQESNERLQNQTEADLRWIKVDCSRCKSGVTQTGETCRFCKGAGYFDQLPTEKFIHR